MVRRSGHLVKTSWDDALNVVAEALRSAAGPSGAGVAGLAGTHVSNEDAYVFQKLFRVGLGSNNIDHRLYDFPMQPMQTSIADIGSAKRIVSVGFDPKEYLPVVWLWIYHAISKNFATYAQVDSIADARLTEAVAAGEGTIILTSDKISSADAGSLGELGGWFWGES